MQQWLKRLEFLSSITGKIQYNIPEAEMQRDEEKFWRARISKEILKYCDHDIEPCVDCHELSIIVKNGGRLNVASFIMQND